MDCTSDKLRSLVRKWQTLIEAHVDVGEMFEIMTRELSSCDLNALVQKFIPEAIGCEIDAHARSALHPWGPLFIATPPCLGLRLRGGMQILPTQDSRDSRAELGGIKSCSSAHSVPQLPFSPPILAQRTRGDFCASLGRPFDFHRTASDVPAI
ncbi:hypothetical protein DFH11DRAFT_1733436 [Phellopilus nigrolimitatus]|nr:hypothetical protein DFH11DRAFT_1733436 [Phellopilus nigrolimitatus]